MHANKSTGQNFEEETAMATTLIENIVNELTMVVVQSVMKEFQAQEARLTVLEKGFETLAQQRLKGLTDQLDHEARLNALERVDLDYKIQRAIEDTDFDDAIKEAVYERIDDELENKGFINEEDLQRRLDHYRFVTESSLIEFLNDRVRITVE